MSWNKLVSHAKRLVEGIRSQSCRRRDAQTAEPVSVGGHLRHAPDLRSVRHFGHIRRVGGRRRVEDRDRAVALDQVDAEVPRTPAFSPMASPGSEVHVDPMVVQKISNEVEPTDHVVVGVRNVMPSAKVGRASSSHGRTVLRAPRASARARRATRTGCGSAARRCPGRFAFTD